MHGFFPIEPILRCFVVALAALIGGNVFVKLASVPMAALFVLGLVKIFIDLNGYFYGQNLSVNFYGYLHNRSSIRIFGSEWGNGNEGLYM
ncbi:hypothetical protein B6259_02540 [Ruminococcaceae bacterium CPB6]|jgi:hypothetical protein|nr:hypothetical protein B6259_02540 [Ruminococcaceae bacterium CPB6]